jgi:DNA-binding FadR family transcriptional regulator
LDGSRLYPSAALHGQVAHEIGRQIVSGVIREGEFLPREAELSERFSVSRQAVREALKVLAAKGLILSRRRAGTCVTPRAAWNLLDPDVLAWHSPEELAPDFLSDLVELRRLIEPAAARLAAARGVPAKIASIGEALDAMRRAVDEPDAFYAADVDFHIAVFGASGNTLIERLSTILRPLLRSSFRLQGEAGGSLRHWVPLHEAVYDAIVARDPAAAGTAMDGVLALASSDLTKAMLNRVG